MKKLLRNSSTYAYLPCERLRIFKLKIQNRHYVHITNLLNVRILKES